MSKFGWSVVLVLSIALVWALVQLPSDEPLRACYRVRPLPWQPGWAPGWRAHPQWLAVR